MTNYDALPFLPLVQHETHQYVFKNEKPDSLTEDLTKIIIDLIKERGFSDHDPQCLVLLQRCLTDFYHNLLAAYKQHIESLGSSITVQDAFQRTLNDVMSTNLRELRLYMKK